MWNSCVSQHGHHKSNGNFEKQNDKKIITKEGCMHDKWIHDNACFVF